MKPFAIILFIAVILALAIRKVVKDRQKAKWREERANETIELRRVFKDYNAYDTFEYIQCGCGYSERLGGIWVIQEREYWEGKICPCCGRRWVFKRRSESDGNL